MFSNLRHLVEKHIVGQRLAHRKVQRGGVVLLGAESSCSAHGIIVCSRSYTRPRNASSSGLICVYSIMACSLFWQIPHSVTNDMFLQYVVNQRVSILSFWFINWLKRKAFHVIFFFLPNWKLGSVSEWQVLRTLFWQILPIVRMTGLFILYSVPCRRVALLGAWSSSSSHMSEPRSG